MTFCTNRLRVTSPADLESKLRSDFTGCIYIPADVTFDMSGCKTIPVHTGVWLIGERGALGSRPTLKVDTPGPFELLAVGAMVGDTSVSANGVRISGIHFLGPENADRTNREYVTAIQITEDAETATGRNIVVEDCEFDQWLGSGVNITSTHQARTPAQFQAGWHALSKGDAGLVLVRHNFMHHNSMDGGGYGVTVSAGAWATVEANVFDFNRHSVSSDGFARTGYIARYNYVLNGGYRQDDFYNQHFDVHGTNDTNGNNASTGYGGSAGEYFEIANNTIRGAQGYDLGFKTRPSFMLRGTPTVGAFFNNNIDVHADLDAAVALKNSKRDTGYGEDQDAFHFHASGNHFQTDNSGQLGAGDFDGDGRTDVIVTTGNAWFYSSAGSEPWQFLYVSDKLVGDLGFADVDNDGKTDILYKDDSGHIVYLKSGRGSPAFLTDALVPMKDIRFGDFDGDGKADMFYTLAGAWHIWYGATRQWKVTPGSSSLPVSAFLFGEFDDVKGTDIAAVTSGMWAISSGATGSWTKLNAQLRSGFEHATAADLDGDGKADIVFDETNDGGDQRWFWSEDGRGPLVLFRDGTHSTRYPPLKNLPIGHFEAAPADEIITYYPSNFTQKNDLDDFFMIWRGGPNQGLAKYSSHAMR
jgi:hypothetical protein